MPFSEFIERANKKHGDVYDFSDTQFSGTARKVTVRCPHHGNFTVFASALLQGFGCKHCAKVNRNKDAFRRFVEQANTIHDNKYTYHQQSYVNTTTPMDIECKIHGVFRQRPNNHISGKTGCPKCGGYSKSSTGEFIERANSVHDNKYDYSKVVYRYAQEKVIITCPDHGEFEQTPNGHLAGYGCNKCRPNVPMGTEEFVKRAQERHGTTRYEYSDTQYVNRVTKVTIVCNVHGPFSQRPGTHLKGSGCPKCSWSKGESYIGATLERLNIPYQFQKSFTGCTSGKGRVLRYDFWVPSHNTLIEYDGEQHTTIGQGRYRVTEQMVARCQEHDRIKNLYAQDNGYNLLRISHTDFNNIPHILLNNLG